MMYKDQLGQIDNKKAAPDNLKRLNQPKLLFLKNNRLPWRQLIQHVAPAVLHRPDAVLMERILCQ